MSKTNLRQRFIWMGGGVVLGLILGGLWPESPAHAVATSQVDSFSVCTAPLDGDGEAIFFLDYLTGDLKGAALNPNTRQFTAFFSANVAQALQVDPSKNPRYLMVSGMASFRQGAGATRLGSSVIYVAEVTTGNVAAYGIPWNQAARNSAGGTAPLVLLHGYKFRDVQVRNP
jgi:hypothetical protein